jgi:DNA modification methylase
MNKIFNENCLTGLKRLADESVNCCVTSPPYWGLRDYGTAKWKGGDKNCEHKPKFKPSVSATVGNDVKDIGKIYYKDICKDCGAIRKDEQLGLEETLEEFVENLVKLFREIKRVLKKDGTVWLNLGDSYSSSGRETTTNQSLRGNNDYGVTRPKPNKDIKPKDLIGIPWRVAFALQSDGWYLRQDIIWHKPNPMPESVTDRCTKSHEYIFLLTKSSKYFYDADAIKEKSISFGNDKRSGLGDSFVTINEKRNKRSVWTVNTKPCSDAHFAVYPQKLIEPCIKAGCPENGLVLDPFMGGGTTAIVARKLNRNYVGFELNDEYIKIAENRLYKELGMFC